eukprot:m.21807 g.21807  ORF g.21807 m.21807 type:complete len:56 (-) comp5390_c0_seq1:1404-1571(-)
MAKKVKKKVGKKKGKKKVKKNQVAPMETMYSTDEDIWESHNVQVIPPPSILLPFV